MEAGKAAVSFVGGLAMTLVLVVIVPVVVETYIRGIIEGAVGDSGFLFLTSDLIVTILVYAVIIGFMVLLGAGGILKRFGWVGIVGLVVAYWLLGDVTDAFLPLLILLAMLVASWAVGVKRSKQEERSG